MSHVIQDIAPKDLNKRRYEEREMQLPITAQVLFAFSKEKFQVHFEGI